MNDDKADPFVAMAARIRAVAEGEFAGAVLIVPPGDGEPLALLNIEPNPNPDNFWVAVKSRVDAVYAAVSEASRNMMGNRLR